MIKKTIKNLLMIDLQYTPRPSKNSIRDGLIITTVTATTAVIFYGLRLVGMRQVNALLTPTSLVCLLCFLGKCDKKLIQ